MARLQVLELPDVHHADGTYETPFILVIDQAGEGLMPDEPNSESAGDRIDWAAIKSHSGARSVIVTTETLDITANAWISSGSQGDGTPADGFLRPDTTRPQPRPST